MKLPLALALVLCAAGCEHSKPKPYAYPTTPPVVRCWSVVESEFKGGGWEIGRGKTISCRGLVATPSPAPSPVYDYSGRVERICGYYAGTRVPKECPHGVVAYHWFHNCKEDVVGSDMCEDGWSYNINAPLGFRYVCEFIWNDDSPALETRCDRW